MNILNYHVPHGSHFNNPQRIIIHAIGEVIVRDGVEWPADKFLEEIGLSCHAIIWPDGDVTRMRNDSEGAYHAKGHNTDTLGIEFAVKGEFHSYQEFTDRIKTPYLTMKQYDTGLWQVRDWMQRHDIRQTKDTIVTHAELSPERKVDPGVGFPQTFFYDL
jgi:N-acetyl-anhydromuramyl-L-alanine amidase AmpD